MTTRLLALAIVCCAPMRVLSAASETAPHPDVSFIVIADVNTHVVVDCEIGPTGKASDCRLVRGFRDDLDKRALFEAETHWRYVPGTRNGQPVAMRLTVTVEFLQPVKKGN